MTPAEHTSESGNTTRSRLRRLIIGRLATAVLLFILSALWTKVRSPEQSLGKGLLLLIIVGGLTFFPALALGPLVEFLHL